MVLVDILSKIMEWCYELGNNYGIAIILFTFISKIILLPLSIWVQKNSIKMVKMQPDINKIKIKYFGDNEKISEEQSKLYKREKYNAFISLIPLTIQILLLMGLVEVIKNVPSNYNLNFLGFNLSWIATIQKGKALWIPILAGLSALLLCVAQNAINVLQAEQSKWNKYGMLILSVGLSLYLGTFVQAGVALYWIISNLLAIVQQWLLNICINPKKYVDYEELEKTNKELKELNSSKTKLTPAQKKKAREDYKKFFKIINKHLVFYSEGNGFYKYYEGMIEYILNNTNMTIHYITSDYNDNIFNMEKENPQIKAYFIDERRLITLMMKMDADVVVMTMPDLETYHIKRSYVRKDIEYIYIPHGMDSLNMAMRKGSTAHFDTIFVTDESQYKEEMATNKFYNIENRKIIKWGYSLLDNMIEDYNKSKIENKVKKILIAPSWQKDNIIDLCLDEILDRLKEKDYEVIVRPHPQHVRHMKEKFDGLKQKYKDDKNIIIQTDFSSNDTVFNADIIITDWSGICFEYAYTTNKPVIFIDTPMKIMNPEYKNINVEPINIWVRNKIGKSIKVDEVNSIDKVIDEMLKDYPKYQKQIIELRNKEIYNLGTSAEVGANYIIEAVQRKINERKDRK